MWQAFCRPNREAGRRPGTPPMTTHDRRAPPGCPRSAPARLRAGRLHRCCPRPAALAVVLTLLLALLRPAVAADDARRPDALPAAPAAHPWRAGVSLTAAQGDYGTDVTQTLVALSALLGYRGARVEARVGVPYLWLSSEDATGATASTEGVGDTRLDARFLATHQRGAWPALSVLAALKLPTADEAEGLGTGETDVTAGAGLDAFLSRSVFWFLDADYTWIGDPPGLELRDSMRTAAGGGVYLGPTLVLSAALEHRGAIYPDEPDAQELSVALARLGTLGWQAALVAGLSDGAPDASATVGVTAAF